MEPVPIARIVDGVVVNIEMAYPDWIEQQADPAKFVTYADEAPARIGDTYDPESGEFTAPL